jgi:hypothetical protein
MNQRGDKRGHTRYVRTRSHVAMVVLGTGLLTMSSIISGSRAWFWLWAVAGVAGVAGAALLAFGVTALFTRRGRTL